MPVAAPDLLARIPAVALEEFAERGYEAASLASIAARAGTSKQNVLYHFGTKQALLAEALEPLLAAIVRFDDDFAAGRVADPARAAVDLVLEHDRAIGLVLFHFASLPDHAIADRALDVFERVAAHLLPGDPRATIRFTIALSGFAYVVAAKRFEREVAAERAGLAAALDDRELSAQLLREMRGLPAGANRPAHPARPSTEEIG